MTKIYENSHGESGADNYRAIESRLSSRQAFRGNSMSARTDADGTYVVISYSTVIATAKGDDIEIAENRWGTTTGRHINLCKRCL